ncbi:hypothetical protein Q5752_005271 [Cryptotrichosporon argae]
MAIELTPAPAPSPIPSSSTFRPTRTLPVLTRADIATRVAAGQSLVLLHGHVLNVTSWASTHPGGALALLHFVGRDASDEVEAYHSDATIARMAKFAVGRVELDDEHGWRSLTPPIQLGLVRHPDGVKGHWKREGRVVLGTDRLKETGDVVVLQPDDLEPLDAGMDQRREKKRSSAYHELKARVTEAGLFNPPGPLSGYGRDIIRYCLLGGTALVLFFRTTHWTGQLLSAAFLGLLYQQLTFVVHDAGHSGITGNWLLDRYIGGFLASWVGGLSLSWWCDNHDVHHLVTNHPEHDPDIQHIPFFAITKDFFGSLWSTYYKRVMPFDAFARAMIPLQHKLYYVVLSLARFNLYALSYGFLFGPKAKHDAFWAFELVGVAVYWAYFGALLHAQQGWAMKLGYLLVSHVCASPVHVQIVLSHFACSTADLGPLESFPSRQLRTTMDVACAPDIEFIHGGLHLQVTHHLFPRLPRHNLRAASLLVKGYCKEHDIEYLEYDWMTGNRKVLGVLQDVADQFRLLHHVAEKEIREKLQ